MPGRRADGFVLVAVMLMILLMSVLVAALVSIASSETLIAANFRHAQEALYAADAAAERALSDLASMADWDTILNGTVQSSFTDGPPAGTRALQSGATIDVSQVVNLANCRRPTPCSSAAMDLTTAERPRGINNPRWQPFAYGKLEDVLPGVATDSAYYAVVLVGDDPSDVDGDPLRDAPPGRSGHGLLALRAEVFGPRSTHRVLELTVGRTSSGGVRVVSWRERR